MTEKCLKYPITTIMVFSAIILLGLISFNKLSVSLLPDIEFPEITIVTEYENASPKEIEHLVTKQIEEAVASVSGVKSINSISSEGISIVKVKFIWGKNMDFAAMEIREKVDLIKGTLPQDVKKSIVLKYNPSDTPIMALSVSSKFYNKIELRRLVEKEIKPALERIDGIAAVNVTGGVEREIKINVDVARLYANNLGLQDVIDALNYANYNYPAGSINKGKKEFIIRVIGEFKNISQIKNLVVARGKNDQPVYLKSIASIEDSFKDITSISHYNGLEDINLSIRKEAMKNTVNVCSRIERKLLDLKEKFQNKINLNIIYSQADFISQSNQNLIFAAILGSIIAFFVLLIFLQDLKSSLIVVISIPVSVITVFIFMYIKKISLNMISMGGIAIGIGMLVDNSIVVLESINRKISEKLPLKEAALQGTNEVKTSVIASTFTSIIVFLPIVFVKGIAGSIFGQLAFSISIALISSLIVSLTLIPLLTTFNINLNYNFKIFSNFPRLYLKFETYYAKLLKRLMPYRKKIIMTGPFILLIGILLFLPIKKELLPPVDEGKFKIRVEAPVGTTVQNTEKFVSHIEKQLMEFNEVKSVFTIIGFNKKNIVLNQTEQMNINVALINVILNKKGYTKKFIKKLSKELKIPGQLKISYQTSQEVIPGLSSAQKKDYLIVVQGKKLSKLRRITDKFVTYIDKQPFVYDAENESGDPTPEYKLIVDREILSSLGLNIKLVAETLQAAIKGKRATYFRVNDDEYDITVRLQKEDRKDKTFLNKIFIKNSIYGINIPLSAFASIKIDKGETTIFRENQQRVMYVSLNLKKSVEYLKELINRFLKKQKISNYSIEVSGIDKETRESMKSLIFAFLLSIILIYMILASQFESLIHPLIIMFSVPLTLTGVAIGLIITGNSLNVISALGLIMLSGIVVNNSIVLFEYFEILKKKNKIIENAVIEACKIRLRPIMMTTLTTILGLIPLAIGLGSGSEIQSPMAITVISGLTFASLLTLIYIPMVYITLEKRLINK